VLSYCGGVNYPHMNTQATSTAPGWCTMLTGVWANVHGIYMNYTPKSNDHLTLLTTSVLDGIADSSAFYVSWKGHFNSRFTTYYPEKKYVEEKGLPVKFQYAETDEGTLQNVKNDLAQKDCSDFLFFIMECVDHTGHTSGFDVKNQKYIDAFHTADANALDILHALEARETYGEEDWLVLITTDHGGCNINHGRCTIQERYTFMFCNKPILAE
jgi:predicted AlkP superfamily pyrophosphatase or phosphodiesterase